MGKRIHPQYGMLRRGKIRKEFSDMWLVDEEIEVDLWELAKILDLDQLDYQDSRCARGEVKEFARGGEVSMSLRNGRMVRGGIIDIAEIMGRADRDLRSRKTDGIPVRIINL